MDWFWQTYAKRKHTRWEKTFLWDMVEPYRRPRSLIPLVALNIAAFYTGVVGAAITEQLYKVGNLASLYLSCNKKVASAVSHEKYWEEHPGEAVPIMKPLFYFGPWKVQREDFKGP